MTREQLRENLLSPTVIERVINEVAQKFLIPKFLSLGMEATGEWRSSLHAEGNILRGRGYTKQLQYGRKPGRKPPIAPLITWVEAKLGLSGRQAVSVAYAVRHKIAEEGTSWYQAGGSDLMDVLEDPQVIAYFHERLGDHIRTEVKLFVSSALNENFKK